LPPLKFALPNVIGCLTWPPIYFMPGILAGVALDIPEGQHSGQFRWLLLAVALLFWLACWLIWRWKRCCKTSVDTLLGQWLPQTRLRWLIPLCWVAVAAAVTALIKHPCMPAYAHYFWQVVRF